MNPHCKVKYLIGGCYRPESDELNNMKNITESIDKINTTKVILADDFNIGCINWQIASASTEVEKYFLEALTDKMLTQIADELTRGRDILDLIITGLT